MKITAIIPARYQSTRLPGKPIMNICGKPMLWWVYDRISKIKNFKNIICAIDDERVQKVCEKYHMKYIMTRCGHPNHISKVHEGSTKIAADYYICVNGDELLITKGCIVPVISSEIYSEPFFTGAMRKLTNPVRNLKERAGQENENCVFYSDKGKF